MTRTLGGVAEEASPDEAGELISVNDLHPEDTAAGNRGSSASITNGEAPTDIKPGASETSAASIKDSAPAEKRTKSGRVSKVPE